jgi:acyl-CoA synthetase (AMP-forming)/AMP-acid ligase II
MNLIEALDFNAWSRPEHPAVIEGDAQLTYAQLSARIRSAQARLESLGIGQGQLVGVCLKDSTAHLVVIHALARAGMVMLPMDCRWSRSEQERLVSHFRPQAVVVEDEADTLDAARCIAVAVIDCPEAHPHGPEPALADDLPLLLSLSSGTTGRPKGPCITHGQMLRRFWTHWINLGLNSRARYVSATPLYFGGGRTFAMSVLFSGGTVILFPPPFDAAALCMAVERYEATSAFLVPTQLRRLLDLGPDAARRLQRLDPLISSGAPLYPDEREAIRRNVCPNLYEYYASTEGGGITLSAPADQALFPDSVGRAVFAVEIQIVDENHDLVPPGTIGRLRYRGPGVASGYYEDDAASSEAFRDGWFYPGDLAEKNEAGYVFIRGRTKDVIIRGGVNIHAAEVEAVLCGHPAVAESAVVGRPSQVLGEEVAAFVVLKAAVEANALATWCRARLAPYKVPRDFIRVDALPKNSAGKVRKAELVARLEPIQSPLDSNGPDVRHRT